MFTEILFLGIAAFSMVSFSNPKQTNQEDFYGFPFNSTFIAATCTSGCYSASSGGVNFPFTGAQEADVRNKLQNGYDAQSILRTSIKPPAFL